jgi:hypothetical protein
VELLIAQNPEPDSRLPFLLRVPLPRPMVFRTSGTWPRTKALYCHPMSEADWPEHPEIVERVPVRSCVRRGAAIDLVLDRGRENRSQIVFTTARGREVVFWQTARVRKQARPAVRTPTARAGGLAGLEIVVDTRERYPWTFRTQQVTTVRRALPCGDYGVSAGNRLVAVVERKTAPDLVSSLTNGTLRYRLGELAALPRAAVVVDDRYSELLKITVVRPATVLDALAEVQVRWPTVPILFCENRSLAEEWAYRYLAAAHQWALTEYEMTERVPDVVPDLDGALPAPAASTAEVRAWARTAGLDVPDRGRLRPEIWAAHRAAHGG